MSSRVLRCAIVSDYGEAGGAAIAANRLQTGLERRSVIVLRYAARFLGALAGTQGDWSVKPDFGSRLVSRIGRTLGGVFTEDQLLQRARARRLLVKLQAFRPDIINLHNLHGVGLPPAVVGELTRIAPVVWTLHDMWAITGGCCHAFDCRKFVTGCDQTCQSRWPLSTRARRQAGHNWQARARLYHDLKRVSFVTPSTWLAAEASQGLLREARIHVIPNGLDLGEYKPLDRAYVRECLGLAPTAKVVLFAAAWLADTHKGLPYLLDALDRLADQYEEVCLLTTGEGVLPETVAPSRVQHVHLGSFVTPRLMRLAYNAADVYALPSLAENLPNTLVEAIACGTPCVGFDVGGVREVIRAGNTGFLAEPENSASLAEALTSVLAQSAGEWQAMSGRCRAIAEAEYGLDLCAQRYLSLFSNLLETEP